MIQLKDVYGRRTTPGVKILFLIVIVIFGLCAAVTGVAEVDKKHQIKPSGQNDVSFNGMIDLSGHDAAIDLSQFLSYLRAMPDLFIRPNFVLSTSRNSDEM